MLAAKLSAPLTVHTRLKCYSLLLTEVCIHQSKVEEQEEKGCTNACFKIVRDAETGRTKALIAAQCVDAVMTTPATIQRLTLVHVYWQ